MAMTRDGRTSAVQGPVEYIDGLFDRLRRLLGGARLGQIEAVHQARVTTRRLRASLELFGPAIEQAGLNRVFKALRQLRRRLGPVRDMDVMIAHLGDLSMRRGHGEGSAWLTGRLLAAREQARAGLVNELDPTEILVKLAHWEKTKARIVALPADVPIGLMCQSLSRQMADFEQTATALASAQGGDPHELRIVGKALRYTMELADATVGGMPGASLKLCKRMQDALGLWHDFVVLSQEAMRHSLECDLALHDSGTQRKVLGFAAECLKHAETHLRAFGRIYASGGGRLSAAVVKLCAAHPISEQTDRGPGCSGESQGPGVPSPTPGSDV